MQCQAKSKQRQAQCRQRAVQGMRTCYYHGGRTPRGPALPQFRTGRYSRLLPSRLLARYRAAEKDPELTSLRDELALVDARLADLLSRVDSGESGTLWRNVTQAYAAFKRDRRLGCVDTMQESLAVFEARLDAATQDHDAWAAVMELIERRRKLAASELRRLVTLESMISAERAMILLGVVVEIIRKYVSDRTVLAQIARELQCLGQHACGDHAVIGGSSITAPRPPKRSSE